MRLFKNTKPKLTISFPIEFPSGIAVKTDIATYWIKDNKRYKLISDRAAMSWRFTTLNATESALAKVKLVGKLGFRDGTLIKNIADGKIIKNKIIGPDALGSVRTLEEYEQFAGIDFALKKVSPVV